MAERRTMFVGGREEALAVLQEVGGLMCGYQGGDWPRRCDCKYGGIERQAYSEYSGCPELASIYVIVNEMTGDEWRTFGRRGGNILIADEKAEA